MARVVSANAFAHEIRRLTELAYLTGIATSLLLEVDPRSAAGSLRERIQELCSDGQKVSRLGLSVGQVKRRSPELPSFVADLLVVRLEALVHAYLAQRAGYAPSEEAPSLEALVLSKSGSVKDTWWLRDLVLLAAVRNAIVHGNGEVVRPNQRLLDAGWSEALLDTEPVLKTRAFSDFLRFKRSVRTGANKLYPPGGTAA